MATFPYYLIERVQLHLVVSVKHVAHIAGSQRMRRRAFPTQLQLLRKVGFDKAPPEPEATHKVRFTSVVVSSASEPFRYSIVDLLV